ncbi:MAG: hypothetical protein HOP27_11430 [Anaerolineales bacterium]|nr:hypothetical protein [Anaerolineales bacterium]
MSHRRKSNTGLVTVIVSFLCVLCVGCSILGLVLSNGGILSFPTPTPLQVQDPSLSIPTIIALTFSAANAQTAAAYSPTPLASATLIPALDALPTATVFIFDLQTSVAQPTDFLYLTNTPFVLATVPPPTAGGAVCACSGGLDCKDFATHNQAQACYEYCRSLGLGDVHGLDGNDKDGLACESLP